MWHRHETAVREERHSAQAPSLKGAPSCLVLDGFASINSIHTLRSQSNQIRYVCMLFHTRICDRSVEPPCVTCTLRDEDTRWPHACQRDRTRARPATPRINPTHTHNNLSRVSRRIEFLSSTSADSDQVSVEKQLSTQRTVHASLQTKKPETELVGLSILLVSVTNCR